jgi:hypothetical protein
MPIVIRPHSAEHVEAVIRFNRRLMAAGAVEWMQVEVQPQASWLPEQNGQPLYNEIFLALENDEVRGAYVLKHQEFSFGGEQIRSIGYYHHPISEGTINKAYAMVGALMIRDALRRQPLLYALGMDGYDKPLPQMLKLLGWKDYLVPFYFRVLHPFRFLRHMEALREGSRKRLLMDFAAFTGAGWIAIKALHGLRARRKGNLAADSLSEVPVFDVWTDHVWESAKGRYSMTAVRSSEVLRKLYPTSQGHFTRLRVLRDGVVVGWAVVAARTHKPRFGSLRVGSIVDCFAAPENAAAIVRAATEALQEQGFDMIVTNQSNADWGRAFERAGFLQGPSNFVFAASPKLSERLSPFDTSKTQTHFTRGDGDGLPHSF